jgi:hypothetical protein
VDLNVFRITPLGLATRSSTGAKLNMFKKSPSARGAAMGIAVIYTAYLAVSIGLTVVVASALSRSGQVFLAHMFGGDGGMAGAVNRMLVVGFYLLSLGYVALTVRTSGHIRGPGQVIGVLSAKVGEELLVLGALYLFNIALFARFRRRQGADDAGAARRGPGDPGRARQETARQGAGSPGTAAPWTADQRTARAETAGPGTGSASRPASSEAARRAVEPYIDVHGRG